MKRLAMAILFFVCGWQITGAQSSPAWIRDGMWAGGLNSCQFCSIDLDLDGRNDLLVFDRMGNRKLTYIFCGETGTTDYRYAPEYASRLPELSEWVITADYNRDGRMDIFTYAGGGVRVFRNTSAGSLSFHLQTNLLKSWYYSGYVGVLVTLVDYPSFADIDGDGDLDLVTFFGLGSYAEFHRNMSMEKFGNCDSLDYRLEDPCWGKFRESEGGNHITLNAPCPYAGCGMRDAGHGNKKDLFRDITGQPVKLPLHTGSTLLATDLNGDGLSDLVLGDVDFPNLIALTNGGTRDSAFMVSQDSLFPGHGKPVMLNSFPAVSFLDIDHDGLNDMVVSPFDASYYKSENTRSCWFYRNTGTSTAPVFTFIMDNLVQESMPDFGSGSNPVPADLNGDGLTDIAVGNYGYYDSSSYQSGNLVSRFTSSVAYLKNNGTAEASSYTLVTTDLGEASKLGIHGLYPAFADLNGDGITDMLCGCEEGRLYLFTGRGDSAGIPVFSHPQSNYQNIKTTAFATPQIFDLDRDGKRDLVIGLQNGTMSWYRNGGSEASPVFIFAGDSLGGVDVTNHNLSYYGYLSPFFFRRNGQTWLLAGSEEGRMRLFNGIDGNLSGRFTESDSLHDFLGLGSDSLRIGWRASGFLGKLQASPYYDMVCGNFSGGLNYFTSGKAPGIKESAEPRNLCRIEFVPDPAVHTVRPVIRCSQGYASSAKAVIMIHDLSGRLVMKQHFRDGTVLCLDHLAPGMYFGIIIDPVNNLIFRGSFIIAR
jgi:hypothetical protein